MLPATPNRYAGIDPGLQGAIAVILPDGMLQFYDMPVFTVRGKREYNTLELARLFSTLDVPTHVAVELVHAMPAQGVSSMFKLGRGVGILEGMLAAYALPHTFLTPQKWQTAVGCVTADKGEHLKRALQLFPANAADFRTNPSGRADAALIAAAARILNL